MDGKKKEGTSRRSKDKYPALKPRFNLKIRYDELSDFDYIHKLNDSEKKWLNDFLEAEVNANKKSPLYQNSKRINAKNNARNRDVYSRAKARHQLVFFSGLSKNSKDAKIDYEEDRIIFGIDSAKLDKNNRGNKR